jgi:uncharacterized protein YdeI (YjbR/CyaY-like superfamily)
VQVKIFNASAEFREWFGKNHDRVAELWLTTNADEKSITYREALDEALCSRFRSRAPRAKQFQPQRGDIFIELKKSTFLKTFDK